jgi:hypothetical protein
MTDPGRAPFRACGKVSVPDSMLVQRLCAMPVAGSTRRQPAVAVAVLDGALLLPALSYAFT